MRFLFVDEIHSVEESGVRGRIQFPERTPARYSGPTGETIVAPGVIAEAMGQLVSWSLMERQEFRYRPVYVFADGLDIHEPVVPGTTVELVGELVSLKQEVVVFSAYAYVEGRCVQTARRCTTFFMPLEELEDPQATQAQYEELRRPGGREFRDEGPAYDFDRLIHSVELDREKEELRLFSRISRDETFYGDHFPRRPVTPLVVINEIINRGAGHLFGALGEKPMQPRRAERVKIKNFVAPDEDFEIHLSRKAPTPGQAGAATASGERTLHAKLIKDGKPIMRGHYVFDEVTS